MDTRYWVSFLGRLLRVCLHRLFSTQTCNMNLHSISTFKSPPSLHITASGHMIILPITDLFKHCIYLRYMQIKPTITSIMVWSPSVVTTVFFTLTLLYLKKICLTILIARGTELYQRELESVGLITWFTCKFKAGVIHQRSALRTCYKWNKCASLSSQSIGIVLIHKFAKILQIIASIHFSQKGCNISCPVLHVIACGGSCLQSLAWLHFQHDPDCGLQV